MANHKSAQKAHRQTLRHTAVNRSNRSTVRTSVKKVESALISRNKDVALAAFKEAESELMRGVQKGLYHKNTAARKISRLCHRIKTI